MEVPFFSFEHTNRQIKEGIFEAFTKVYESQNYILGNHLKVFEDTFANYSGTKHAIGVGNGLDALKICLLALGIEKDDEVIVPSHTFIATVLAVVSIGAKPILIDADISTNNIDIDQIESKITPKTKAIIPVHMYGLPCEMDRIMDIAHRHHLFVIEDNAQAHGAHYNNKKTGSIGHLNASSFYPVKNLGALGDGGIITTNDDELYHKCLKFRNYGSAIKYEYEELGLNSRLDELQASFLSVKMAYLDDWNQERQNIASFYLEKLNSVSEIILPQSSSNHVFHLFTIRTKYRDELKKDLTKNGIGAGIHYPIPTHLQKAYQYLGYQKGGLPIAEEIANTTLSLPLFIGISETQLQHVCDTILNFYNK